MTSSTKTCKCGKTISANKECCAQCAVREVLGAKPYPEGTTHILVNMAGKNPSQEDLYRADGMLVASRQADVVRFGNDMSTAQNRLFLSEKLASLFIRRVADIDVWAHEKGIPLVGNKLANSNDAVYLYAQIPENLAIIELMDGDTKNLDDGVRLFLPGNMSTIKH